MIDIGKSPRVEPNQEYYFVLIVDARRGLSNATATPGADIDAVGAIGSIASSPQRTNAKIYQNLQNRYQDSLLDSLYPPRWQEQDVLKEPNHDQSNETGGKQEEGAQRRSPIRQ